MNWATANCGIAARQFFITAPRFSMPSRMQTMDMVQAKRPLSSSAPSLWFHLSRATRIILKLSVSSFSRISRNTTRPGITSCLQAAR